MGNEYQIKFENPPSWILEGCQKRFSLNPGTVFAYDKCIYNPDKIDIPFPMFIHELTHLDQQKRDKMTPELWWQKYLDDASFRLTQEVEAYGNQFTAIRKRFKDRNQQARELHDLATMLSSPQYGSLVGHGEAIRLIKAHSK